MCIVMLMIFTIISMIFCSILIYYSDQNYQSLQQVQCATGRIPYTMLNGNYIKNWIGLKKSLENCLKISLVLENYYENSTQTLWLGTEKWLTPIFFPSVLYKYYTSFKDKKVTNPNPLAKTQVPLDYITNLGPQDINTSYTGIIQLEYEQKLQNIVNIFFELKIVSVSVLDNLDSVLEGYKDLEEKFYMFYDGIKKVDMNIYTWIIDHQELIQSSWCGVAFGIVVWGWFINSGVLLAFYIQIMSKPEFLYGLCCFWVFMGLASVVGFLATTGSLAVGLVVRDSCGLIDDILTTDGIKKYNILIPGDIGNYIDVCLNGNGDLQQTLNLTEFLTVFLIMAETNKTLNTYNLTSNLANFTSITDSILLLSHPINYINAITSNINIDYLPSTNLLELNKYTNAYTNSSYQLSCKNKVYDQWVFSSIDCPDNYLYINNSNPIQNLGLKTCLVIQQWNSANINYRYYEYFNSCTYKSQIGDYIKSIKDLVNAMSKYAKEVDNLYGLLLENMMFINLTLYDLVNELIMVNEKRGNWFSSRYQNYELFESTVGVNGLNGGFYCDYLKDYLSSLKMSICGNSLENVYEVFICLFFLSVFMLLLKFASLCLNRVMLKYLNTK
ncbi:hypothetical protein SteCoe_26212 [Stentor coeruleus]|uniref:Uncharacterized protein n=1 Tax=Stentor coeruleus TaxID=5963 RepID=A0A1R2BDG4_9CILI|nr:hypothetical protein SteCoe_26212 [Stentor coeruleus]